ncbi:hypothetical protein TPHA_0A05180 [Tetrapisispora phaffii CBS 4417]|uniref:Topoisomerase I damage affected protein 11 n=1 Tax=Tetrapisispora phaffii (strain ATCC 24235 / CBS 4417 / NBRC 1672 / NRRL Y-8282 / UCD 70-5) TaxID=1071381 RepID=G8BNW5_TETPH|nr:hypothetical protein TPHA_0A05180 [Tetrapisispora phaffii CBS 4417]CCE61593.1 hypothetical protein TPHA_0A05180 [Tetrapisispora phaffii CBS 4417]
MTALIDDTSESRVNGKTRRIRDSLSITNFDEFIENGDSMLKVDTTTRQGTIRENRTTPSPKKAINENTVIAPVRSISSNRNQLSPKSLTPTRLNSFEHPLRENEDSNDNNAPLIRKKISRSNTKSNRRSLIQPIAVPSSPNNESINGAILGASQLSPNQANDRLFQTHKRILSNTSYHSRQNSSNSVLTDTSIHNNNPINSSRIGEDPTNDINTLLKKLASKEQELLEMKQRIEDTKKQLISEEQMYNDNILELKELKVLVSKHLNTNNATVITSPVKIENNIGDSTINSNTQLYIPKVRHSSGTKIGLSNLDSEHNGSHMNQSTGLVNEGIDNVNTITDLPKNQPSKRVSSWKNPLSLFNQLDQRLQQEVEKKLYADTNTDPHPVEGMDSQSLLGSETSQIKKSPSKLFPPLTDSTDELASEKQQAQYSKYISADDYVSINAASEQQQQSGSSLWNFVSGMKTGLLGITEKPESGIYQRNMDAKRNAKSVYDSNNKDQYSNSSSDLNVNDIKQFKTPNKVKSVMNDIEDVEQLGNNNDESSDNSITTRRNKFKTNVFVELKDF